MVIVDGKGGNLIVFMYDRTIAFWTLCRLDFSRQWSLLLASEAIFIGILTFAIAPELPNLLLKENCRVFHIPLLLGALRFVVILKAFFI